MEPDQTVVNIDTMLQSSLSAIFTTAALVGVFSLCLPVQSGAFAAPSPGSPQSGEEATNPVAPESPESVSPPAQRIDAAPNAVDPTAPAEPPLPIPAAEAFTRLSLDLSPPRLLAGQLGGARGFALHAPTLPRSGADRWRARAEAFVPDWQTPPVRDLSVFVANDDEALSWSFSHASPNYGRMSYQGDRVDIGKLAAGVSLAMDDSQLALAYVQRSEPSQLGYTAQENYTGLIWTFHR